MIYSQANDQAVQSISILMSQIQTDRLDADTNTKKAMLRSIFARHHRQAAKQARAMQEHSKSGRHYARARRLESRVSDYANDLTY